MVLLNQMTILFLMMLIGFYCRKRDILNDEANKRISALVLNVANPTLILSSSINQEVVIEGMEFVKTFFLAWAMFGVMLILGQFIPILLRTKKSEYGTYRAMTIFSNIGFMGFPLISVTYGDYALLYASLFLIPFNVLIYTYGIHIMAPLGKAEKFSLKKVFNVGVVSCIISLIIYLLKIPMPQVIEKTVDSMSGLTAPLSMILIGDSLTKLNLKKLFCNVRLLIFSVIKLIVIPFVGVTFLKIFGLNPILLGVCMIMLSTPVGSMTAMLAQQYDGEYELASSGVAITTILAVGTMPLIAFLTGV